MKRTLDHEPQYGRFRGKSEDEAVVYIIDLYSDKATSGRSQISHVHVGHVPHRHWVAP